MEFALVLLVFTLLTLGLLDGVRVSYYYSQVQEAARAGARWGAVEVARAVGGDGMQTPWGTFASPGNAPGVYCDNVGGSDPACPAGAPSLLGARTITATAPLTPSIVGVVAQAGPAVDLATATVTISTTIPPTATEPLQVSAALTDVPVTVTVSYPFHPLLGAVFGGVTIPLRGSSAMLHE